MSEDIEDKGTIVGFGYDDAVLLARMTNLALEMDNPSFAEIRPNIPVTFLFAHARDISRFSRVREFLNGLDIRSEDLKKLLVLPEEGKVDFDELKERILVGEFGNPATALSKAVIFFAQESPRYKGVEDLAENYWLELIDHYENIPDTKAIINEAREVAIDKKWYWRGEIADVAVKALDKLDVPTGQEEEFVERHRRVILEALWTSFKGSYAYEDIERLVADPETIIRLGTIFRTIRQLETHKSTDLHSELPNYVIASCLGLQPAEKV